MTLYTIPFGLPDPPWRATVHGPAHRVTILLAWSMDAKARRWSRDHTLNTN